MSTEMSEQEALQYIATSRPDSPVFQKALISLNRGDSRKTRLIAWIALAVSVTSLAVSILSLALKTR